MKRAQAFLRKQQHNWANTRKFDTNLVDVLAQPVSLRKPFYFTRAQLLSFEQGHLSTHTRAYRARVVVIVCGNQAEEHREHGQEGCQDFAEMNARTCNIDNDLSLAEVFFNAMHMNYALPHCSVKTAKLGTFCSKAARTMDPKCLKFSNRPRCGPLIVHLKPITGCTNGPAAQTGQDGKSQCRCVQACMYGLCGYLLGNSASDATHWTP